MAYIVVEASVRTHWKFLTAGPDASWLWLCGLGYCQDGLTDGFIPRSAIGFLGVREAMAIKLAPRLVTVSLWETRSEANALIGWQMHDYLDHNKSAAEIRSLMKRRGDGGKLGGRPKTLKVTEQNLQGLEVENLTRNPLLSGTTGTIGTPDRHAPDRACAAEPPVWRKPAEASRGAGTGHGLVNGAALRSHAGHAWCSEREGLCVPEVLHREFMGRGMKTDAELKAWYRSTVERFAGFAIGEDAFTFWRNNFNEWVKAATSRPSASRAPLHTPVESNKYAGITQGDDDV